MTKSIAYLVNQYPSPSHSFIRREIRALEDLGWQVQRFSHRRADATLVDQADIDEVKKTSYLISNTLALGGAVLRRLLAQPVKACTTLILAWRMAWQGERRFLAHTGYFILACALCENLAQKKLQHLHAHFGINPADVALLCHQLCGIKYSFTVHATYEYDDPNKHQNLRRKISAADFVVAISKHGLASLSHAFPEFKDKFKMIRCGLDASWLDVTPTPVPSQPKLLSVARLAEQKNPELLIKAVANLRDRGLKVDLILVGDGPLRPRIEQMIEAYALKDFVTVAGWCNQDQIRQHLRQARALVFSSRSEGIPVAIMEAFTFGRPVVAPQVGGVGELVINDRTGWLYPEGDLAGLTRAIQDCITCKDSLIQSYADAAAVHVRSYDIQDSALALAGAFLRAGPEPLSHGGSDPNL